MTPGRAGKGDEGKQGERKVAMVTGSLGNIWRTAGCLPELSHHSVEEGGSICPSSLCPSVRLLLTLLGYPTVIQPAPVPQEVPLAKDADVQTGKLGVDTRGPAWCEQG